MSWTRKRRRRQAELIRQWKPWEQSTGPRTHAGKRRSSKNACKGGVRRQLRHLRTLLDEMEEHLHSAFNHD